MPVAFTINNGFTITSAVQLSKISTMVPNLYSITGTFQNVRNIDNINGTVNFERIDNFYSITIDGDSTVQGSNQKIDRVFDKISAAITNGTGRAMIIGKQLVVQTR